MKFDICKIKQNITLNKIIKITFFIKKIYEKLKILIIQKKEGKISLQFSFLKV
ncbi:hypothetical protein HMPREF0554_0984 [Pseudoleptotrichia goodfellowii F0264]|uniref:Uncharacterized protein n=1 Tax=Pseudoleptotrichia goodfellowii F0264 TaxID=596323 RepID=D0GJ91_9FUSO|nr:hypothetical protein HMPREF0554_0984 [Pseudoleptotrichia goodfellowii F0264]